MTNLIKSIFGADARVYGHLARNPMFCACFVLSALATQFLWALVVPPDSMTGRTIKLIVQILFGVGAACHAIAAVIVVCHHTIKETIDVLKGDRT